MKHSAIQSNFYYLKKYVFVVFLVCLFFNSANGASQGKLGNQSSASVDVSVTVNQSLRTVSANELILDSTKQNQSSSMPFCIAHNGFKKNASVPYELIVDSVSSPNKDLHALPYKLYLEDKNTSKLLLNNRTTIAKQSTLYLSEEIVSDCAEYGLKLSIEKNNTTKKEVSGTSTVGLMILLVSPY